jgi:hypothetical protein
MAANPRTLVWYVRFRDLAAKLKAAGIGRAERAAALWAVFGSMDDARTFRAVWMADSARGSLRLVVADDAPSPSDPREWFEVHSHDKQAAAWFRTEDMDNDPYEYATEAEARQAAQEYADNADATATFRIERVRESRVDVAEVTVSPTPEAVPA